ncbi:MAG: hypothetical protein ACI9LX_000207 [Paraglaciecola sp.]|jgi:hypothetical protein
MQKPLQLFKREGFAYQAAYCEENIWHLCQQNYLQDSYVVFIFSKGDAFPMLNQRACEHPTLPIFWDYHVVLLVKNINKNNQIFDFDTRLVFNTDIDFYFSKSFVNQGLLSDQETPLFRLVPSDEFASSFSSDRSHMKTLSGWLSPPPNWPIIGNKGTNLAGFIQTKDNQFGELLTYDALLRRFIKQ